MCQYFSAPLAAETGGPPRRYYGNIQEASMTEDLIERTLYVR
jgi:hypothetical protein